MHLGQGQVELIGDLGGTLPLMFVPDDDVLHGDPMSRDTWFPTGDAGSGLDMLMHRSLKARFVQRVARGKPRQAHKHIQAHRQTAHTAQTARLIRPAAIDLRRLAVQGDDNDQSA